MSEDQTREFGQSSVPVVDSTDTDTTVYNAMRSELSKPVGMDPVALVIPARPEYEMIFDPAIEYDLVEKWSAKAYTTDGKSAKKVYSPLKFAFAVLSYTNKGMMRNGKRVLDNDGDDLIFSNPELHQIMSVRSPQQCIKALYGLDGHIIQTAGRVLEEAGYGDIDIESGENPLAQG